MSYRGKALMVGSPNVGKTSLLARYVDNKFSDVYHQTIGANFLIKEIDLTKINDNVRIENPELRRDISQKGFKLYFWDVGGQQDKLFANEYYFVQAVGAMVVFSLNSYESFKDLDFWISKLRELSGEVPYILVGNKSDLRQEVDREMVEDKAKKLNIEYFETSAKLNKNVDLAFESLSIQILNNLR
ncbi:MAG: Rab family GTPase [Candidatus Heimdallarchaeota archaeon]